MSRYSRQRRCWQLPILQQLSGTGGRVFWLISRQTQTPGWMHLQTNLTRNFTVCAGAFFAMQLTNAGTSTYAWRVRLNGKCELRE